eukprot:85680-Prorocentrum_minimum.AAC.1
MGDPAKCFHVAQCGRDARIARQGHIFHHAKDTVQTLAAPGWSDRPMGTDRAKAQATIGTDGNANPTGMDRSVSGAMLVTPLAS